MGARAAVFAVLPLFMAAGALAQPPGVPSWAAYRNPEAPGSPARDPLPSDSKRAFGFQLVAANAPNTRLDDVLEGLEFVRQPVVWGGQVYYVHRALPWLWLGGASGLRTRAWNRSERSDARAMAMGAMGLVQVRFRVGSRVQLGGSLGIGGAGVGLSLNNTREYRAVLWVHGMVFLSVRLASVRLLAGLGNEYLRTNGLGGVRNNDLVLGGAQGLLGVEFFQ